MPHFIRFLCWVEFGTGKAAYELGKRAVDFYDQSDLPIYLISKTELVAVIVLLPTALFVFAAVGLLLVRCMYQIVIGKTQIEIWEYEKIESQFHTERFWRKVRHNYKELHGKNMPKLVSWTGKSGAYDESARADDDDDDAAELEFLGEDNTSDIEDDSDIVPQSFSPDDLVFPYDLGFWANLTNALGSPWSWPVPWAGPKGDGVKFDVNDDDDQLNLPWPPDGGNVEFAPNVLTDDQLLALGNASLIKKHLDPRSQLPRKNWSNEYGETLTDYGVDMDAEAEQGLA